MVRALFFALIFMPSTLFAAVEMYDRAATRAHLFQLIQAPVTMQIEVRGHFNSPKAKAFLEFYRSQVVPGFIKQLEIANKLRPYQLLLDGASYDSDEERDLWVKTIEDLEAQLTAIQTSPDWGRTIKEWARLAEGLTGQLPDQARLSAKTRKLSALPPEQVGLLTELDHQMMVFSEAQKLAPANDTKHEAEKEFLETAEKFKAGKITFQTAQLTIDRLVRTAGSRHVGMQAVKAEGDALNRSAVLRSKIAKQLGFTTWAAYQTERQDQGYLPEYRSPKLQRELLYDILKALRPASIAYYDRRIKELGADPKTVRYEHRDLLFEDGTILLRKYFPALEISKIWEKNLLASGFTPELLSHIIVDDQVRDGKNTNDAYLATIIQSQPKVETIDAATLDITWPENARDWELGLMYILQSYPNGGVDSLATAFHEGGHATEHLVKNQTTDEPEGYGYLETPSTTMEQFTKDPDVLLNYALEVDGQKPTREEIVSLLENDRHLAMLEFQQIASQALFDIELWDYDYSAPGADTLLQRARMLHHEIELLLGHAPSLDSPANPMYRWFTSSHFVSGEVRYIGYVYAAISSAMMVDFISDTLEKSTGRRSWFQQPSLASIFVDQFFTQGWKQPFPTNIETITGRKFDPMQAVRTLIGTDCDQLLRVATLPIGS